MTDEIARLRTTIEGLQQALIAATNQIDSLRSTCDGLRAQRDHLRSQLEVWIATQEKGKQIVDIVYNPQDTHDGPP